MTIGFIGLGTMGAHMAASLQRAGHALLVHDLRREAAEPHLARGAAWAATPAEVARRCGLVFTSLPGPPEIEAVVFGPGGLLEGAHAGMAHFDLSTSSPSLVRRVHDALAERGAQALDAPVSGGPEGARTGRLAIWVGGDRATYERHKPVLDAIGDRATHIGPIGTATVAKLAHNLAGYTTLCAMAEVFTMGVKAGMDPLELWRAVRQGALGRRRTFDGLADQFLPGRFEPPAFALRLAHKDVSLACALARELGVPMPIGEHTLREMTSALERGWGGMDSRIVALLQQERAGVAIRCDPDAVRAALEADPKA
jgi:3-hydroxyisobutyrate dehydrogenase-like beta-hydroxyacid dehydrogenase